MSYIQGTAQAVTLCKTSFYWQNFNIKNDYFWNVREKFGRKRKIQIQLWQERKIKYNLVTAFFCKKNQKQNQQTQTL